MNTRMKLKPEPPPVVLPTSSLNRRDARTLENMVSPYGNPSKVFDRKVEHLAHILNCTEEEATHELLHRL